MSPRVLLQRMNERFKLLAAKGNRIDRQATMRATLDWSWDLLPPDERAALAQLSVFEGGFTLEAAEAVLGFAGPSSSSPSALDAVSALVDKSLVRPRAKDRFDLLVTVQVYAAEHLQSEGRYVGSGAQALPRNETHTQLDGLALASMPVGDHWVLLQSVSIASVAPACTASFSSCSGSTAGSRVGSASSRLPIRAFALGDGASICFSRL